VIAKRILDLAVAAAGLVATAPVLVPVLVATWAEDRHSPFYIANRVGRGGESFRMVKVRSMVVNADKSGVDSTAADDKRITRVGAFVRRFKLDELPQLWNVLKGDMSIVGPRPNVARDVALYTTEEQRLLSVRPGITDLSSVVFSDEGQILEGAADPDLDYNQRIRPYKSRLGLLLIDNETVLLDLWIIGLTAVSIVSRQRALHEVGRILDVLGADAMLQQVAARHEPLRPYPPPGAADIVRSRAPSDPRAPAQASVPTGAAVGLRVVGQN
jgi:lipopolysaccharide/colanic/teichoic acid biosynthesis glycosyltransferase